MNENTLIDSAYMCYQKRDLQQAEMICKDLLSNQPENYDALHLLGIIHYQLGSYSSAIEYLKKALQFDPGNNFVYFNLGNVFRDKLRLDEAIACYRKAIEIDTNFDDAYYNLGITLEDTGNFDEALSAYKNALHINPQNADVSNNIGTILQKKEEFDEAILYFKKALQINSQYFLAYHNLGNTFQKKNQPDEAIIYYQKALQLNPKSSDTYFNLGTAFTEKGQYDKAIDNFQKALQLNPKNSEAYYNLGITLTEKGKYEEAIASYKNALQMNPNNAKVCNNLGITYMGKGHVDEAISCYRKSIQIDSGDAEAHWNLSLALLLSGNFKEGWKEYEWRLKVKEFHQRIFSQPLWDGSEILGRTILLYSEQGFGDTLQFIRYAPLIAQRGVKVIVECQKELYSLVQTVDGVEQVIVRGAPLPDFEVRCPLLSLPFILGTTLENIPSSIPYIKIEKLLKDKWLIKIQNDDSKVKIGLVWSGNPIDREDRNRSFALEVFSTLSQFENINVYSLQFGEAAKQTKNPPKGLKIMDYTNDICDFSDTAALIDNLDLVISVDTAVAHLAGALGKPVWTLLPFAPDWRWLLNREDSPWYPTMRLFRQSKHGDWKSVIAEVSDELQILIAKIV
jgi:tetratricopeptide (TPR) repeat protein